MTEYRYPASATAAACLRAAAGLALTLAPLAATRPSPLPASVLGGCALLFGAYGVRALLRRRTRIRVDRAAIRAEGPLPLVIAWRDLTRVRLAYYATRRDGSGGWMQLSLKGAGRALRIDSSLAGFAEIAGRAARAAEARGVELTGATRNNLRALGIATADAPAREERSWPIC